MTLNRNTLRVIAAHSTMTLIAIAASGCGQHGDPQEGPAQEFDTTLQMISLVPTNTTDVKQIRFELTEVDCDTGRVLADTIVKDRKLEDQIIPGNISDLANRPLDEDSTHLFADLFQVLDAGCYDVRTMPLTKKGEDSEICVAAHKEGVVVKEGKTTEVLLINQCEGVDPGALDVISALNREPTLDDVNFPDSKFICGSPGEVCVTAHDQDGDPLELNLLTDGACEISPRGSAKGTPMGGVTQCWTVSCDDFGRADLSVVVHDLLVVDEELVRIEDWLAEEGYPNESRAQLDFFAYFDGIKYYADEDGDGFGDPQGDVQLVCEGDQPPRRRVLDSTDCDDSEPTAFPGNAEVCDGIDNDCNGEVDEDIKFDGDLEIVMLQDLSGSFAPDLPVVRRLIPELHAAVNACVGEARFGAGSFIDKPIFPFGTASDYSYQIELGLTPELEALQAAYNAMLAGSGRDPAESQLTALMHAALDSAEYGFTTSAKRVFVLFTDNDYHVAGDCSLASCPSGENNGDSELDEFEDYPQVSQAAAALQELGIELVFAVTPGASSTYENLLTELEIPGSVVDLNPDSSNLVDAVLTGLECQCGG